MSPCRGSGAQCVLRAASVAPQRGQVTQRPPPCTAARSHGGGGVGEAVVVGASAASGLVSTHHGRAHSWPRVNPSSPARGTSAPNSAAQRAQRVCHTRTTHVPDGDGSHAAQNGSVCRSHSVKNCAVSAAAAVRGPLPPPPPYPQRGTCGSNPRCERSRPNFELRRQKQACWLAAARHAPPQTNRPRSE